MSALQTVQRLFEAFARQDLAAIRDTLDPHVEWRQCAGFPGGGHHVGLEAVMAGVFGKFGGTWESFRAVVHEYIPAEGDRVVVLGEYVGRHRVTGKEAHAAFAHVFTVVGGRVTRFQQFADTQPLHEAMRGE